MGRRSTLCATVRAKPHFSCETACDFCVCPMRYSAPPWRVAMTPDRFRDPLYAAVEHLPVGFQVVDFDWRYVYVNPAAAAHARRPVGDLEGKSMLDCYP